MTDIGREEMTPGPIFLTGFMATGKSKVGHLLARKLNCRFVDTDELIQDRASRTIAEIFETDGEELFRQLEYECLVEVSRQSRVVVALGGGAITQERNREVIRSAAGLLVCLEAAVETILERVGRKQTRPLLAGLDAVGKREKINRMLAERAPYYAVADLTIHSSADSTAEQTAQQLFEELRKRRGSCAPSN